MKLVLFIIASLATLLSLSWFIVTPSYEPAVGFLTCVIVTHQLRPLKSPATQRRSDVIRRKLVPGSPINTDSTLHAPLHSFLGDLTTYILNDQIHKTGGWGKSQESIFQAIYHRTPKDSELQEGGIISSYFALRALIAQGVEVTSWNGCGKSAVLYLLTRQDHHGGFGRFVESRSGLELKTSYRHTAMAILALLLTDGPSERIESGMRNLLSITQEDVEHDVAPSLSAATVLLCLEAVRTRNYKPFVSKTILKDVKSFEKQNRSRLFDFIVCNQKDVSNPYAPLWKPYGDNMTDLFFTALGTVDFLSCLTTPPIDCIVFTLNHIASLYRDKNGIPYGPDRDLVDPGMSLYFATLCSRTNIKNAIAASGLGYQTLDLARRCIPASITSWNVKALDSVVYIDTISNAALMEPQQVRATPR